MIEAVLDLDSSSVEQIMRPRVEVVALSTDDSLLALLEANQTSIHYLSLPRHH